MLTRRQALLRAGSASAGVLFPAALLGCGDDGPAADREPARRRDPRRSGQERRAFAALERRYRARLAVYAVDTGSGRTLAFRADDRIAYCSTVKLLLAAAVMRPRTVAQLDTRVRLRPEDIMGLSEITQNRAGTEMTIRALCDAAIRYSDNGAANTLFRLLGGPVAFERELRRGGDRVTTADRLEPALSSARPGDRRDTTTARQLATNVRRVVLGDGLDRDKRALLDDWLRRNTTGDDTIRAGIPRSWTVGDKTGTGGYGVRNDVAILRPPGREPIVLAVLSTKSTREAEADDALLASAARVVARSFVPSAR